jgi:hypothetical protein
MISGEAGQGLARQGAAWLGVAGRGEAREFAQFNMAWRGMATVKYRHWTARPEME